MGDMFASAVIGRPPSQQLLASYRLAWVWNTLTMQSLWVMGLDTVDSLDAEECRWPVCYLLRDEVRRALHVRGSHFCMCCHVDASCSPIGLRDICHTCRVRGMVVSTTCCCARWAAVCRGHLIWMAFGAAQRCLRVPRHHEAAVRNAGAPVQRRLA